MNTILEAALTSVGLVGGYMIAAIVVVMLTPRQERLTDRIASAAVALGVLFALCVVVFVGSEFWLDSLPEAVERIGGPFSYQANPTWLDAVNKASENMLSEVFQIWLAALVFKHLRWPGSPESK